MKIDKNRLYKLTSAENLKCLLLFENFPATAFIRTTDSDKKTTDFDLRYLDLEITINSDDATIYEDEFGNKKVDYNPATLGYDVVPVTGEWVRLVRGN